MSLTIEQNNFIRAQMPEYVYLTRERKVFGRALLVDDIVEEWLSKFGNTAKDGDRITLQKVS